MLLSESGSGGHAAPAFHFCLHFLLLHCSYHAEDPLCQARLKAFSTCGPHPTVVTIFNGIAIYMYLKFQSKESQEEYKFFSIFYGAVTPVLIPLIYTEKQGCKSYT